MEIHLKNSKTLTSYGFACGYKNSYIFDDNNDIIIDKIYYLYRVLTTIDGVTTRTVFETLSDARKFLKEKIKELKEKTDISPTIR